MNDFEIYFRDLQADAKHDGVRVDRAETLAVWKSVATQELIEAVKAYALAHYEKDGWDYVVECYSDADLAEIIKGCRTASGAIKRVRAAIKPRADYRSEIQSEAF
jgi:hypothetical protein